MDAEKNTRSAMENNIILQVGVKALLQNSEGKYLLLRRSLEKYPEIKGRWDIVGGRIDPGSILIENLRREIKEETNLELIGEPKLIAAQDIRPKPDKHIVRLTYIGKVNGQIKVDKSENDSYKWYSAQELKNIDDLDIYFKELLDKNLINV
ncbi:MAG: NUDIX hydrolase [bacterium]|nr:NUDIX hydrolase [bacterium]